MIRDIKSGQDLTAQQLAGRLSGVSRVVVGMQYDNPDHQALQLWLLQMLADRRAQGSLLLEMLAPAQQSCVDAVRADFSRSVYTAELPAALHWPKEWNWALYGPVIRYALAQPYALLAAGLDTGEPGRHGDLKMAECLLSAPLPALLLTGIGHAGKHTGVPIHLSSLGVTEEPLVLLLARQGTAIEPGSADYVWFTSDDGDDDV